MHGQVLMAVVVLVVVVVGGSHLQARVVAAVVGTAGLHREVVVAAAVELHRKAKAAEVGAELHRKVKAAAEVGGKEAMEVQPPEGVEGMDWSEAAVGWAVAARTLV